MDYIIAAEDNNFNNLNSYAIDVFFAVFEFL